MNAHAALRAATRDAHDRLDTLFQRCDLAERDDYSLFLVAHAAALIPIEDALGRAGAARLVEGWDDHRRSPLLERDLGEMNLPLPSPFAAPDYRGDAEVIGGAYVLEGSRLGAAVLAPTVGPEFSRHFLSARPGPRRWRQFVERLEHYLPSPVERERAGRAALKTFECFEDAAGMVMGQS